MPVTKLKSLDDTEETLWRAPDDPLLWRQIDSLWRMSARVTGVSFPPGVYKHRTIADANRLTDRWDGEGIAATRARRSGP